MKRIFMAVGLCSFLVLQAGEPMADAYFVILAGGGGERLWPLSTHNKPKQLLVAGQQYTLLEQAINRVKSLAPKENIWVSTTAQHEHAIKKAVGSKIGLVLAEPGARDTGPAILLNCFEIYKKNPEALVVFLPADPFIPESDAALFAHSLETAIAFSRDHDHITLLGVKPTYPATGYGYIEYASDDANADELQPCKVKRFREKPSADVAQQYLEAGNMLWNIGMFCGKVSVFMHEFKQEAPDIFDSMVRYIKGEGTFDQIKADSIDYAVMEKSHNISVLPVSFSWCDVGNLEIFLTIKEQHGVREQNCITVQSKNNLIDVPGKLVALIGVEDLCIVETEHALLLAKRGEAEKVRAIVKQLKQGARTDYL
jgi:mannose-1-phosphate guanylyltransferase